MKKTNFYCFLPSFVNNSGHENSYLEVFELFSKIKKINSVLFVSKNNSAIKKLNFKRVFYINKVSLFFKVINIFRNLNAINRIVQNNTRKNIIYVDGHSLYFLISLIASKITPLSYNKLILFCRYKYNLLQKAIFLILIYFLNKKFGNCYFITDNLLNYNIFKKKFNFENVFFFPTPFFDKKKIKIKKIKNFKNILCPGQYRKEKFGKNLQEFLEFNRKANFTIHISKKFNSFENRNFLINNFSENLERRTYLKYLIFSDIVILPYNENDYKFRTSGIFFEAINFSKIIFVTKNTWFANEFKKNHLKELIVNDWSKFDIFKRLSKLNIKKTNLKINIMKKKYLNFHNKFVFVKKLNRICEK